MLLPSIREERMELFSDTILLRIFWSLVFWGECLKILIAWQHAAHRSFQTVIL